MNESIVMNEKKIAQLLEDQCPELWQKIKSILLDSERQYCAQQGTEVTQFLWYHSLEVAHIAQVLADQDLCEPFHAVTAALLHDSGKFVAGQYHDGDRPEEAVGADLTQSLLDQCSAKLDQEQVNTIALAIALLYRETGQESAALHYPGADHSLSEKISRIIHDADRLSKMGHLGLANFFLKAGMRGKPLLGFLGKHLSKELTYAANAHLSMLTKPGQALAKVYGRDSYRLLQGLIDQLQFWGLSPYAVEKIPLIEILKQSPGSGGTESWAESPPSGSLSLSDAPGIESVLIHLARPLDCPRCSSTEYAWTFSLGQGVKCRKLEVKWSCRSCGQDAEQEFCLPEIFSQGPR